MADDNAESVTLWIRSLEAAMRRRRGEALAPLLRGPRPAGPGPAPRARPRAVADEEDAALSAFDSFCRGAARGRFPRLDDRDDLWRLLVVITERKAARPGRARARQKRGGGRVLGIARLADADGGRGAWRRVAGAGADARVRRHGGRGVPPPARPAPRRRRSGEVARLKMEGYTNEEIAARLGLQPADAWRASSS